LRGLSLTHSPELSAALHSSLRLFVAAALRAEASDVLPASFHQALGTLLCDVVRAHASEWRDSAIVRQPSLPRLVDFDWRVDVKTASDSAAQMSVPTVLMRMTLAGSAPPSSSSTPAPAPGAPVGTETVTFELTRDALKTLLESMTKIRAQLQSISN
jgi:COMM domain containing 9